MRFPCGKKRERRIDKPREFFLRLRTVDTRHVAESLLSRCSTEYVIYRVSCLPPYNNGGERFESLCGVWIDWPERERGRQRGAGVYHG